MLTILLVITSFWALIVWVLVEKFAPIVASSALNSDPDAPRCPGERGSAGHSRPSSRCVKADEDLVPAALKKDEDKGRSIIECQDTAPSPTSESEQEAVRRPESVSQEPRLIVSGKFCPTPDSCEERKKATSEPHIPFRIDCRKTDRYSQIPNHKDAALFTSGGNSNRRTSVERGPGRSVSVTSRRGFDIAAAQVWKEDVEAQVRGRSARRDTKKDKLLRKRRRILSQLQERDIDELLRLYFFSEAPPEDFEFATPINVDERILIPSLDSYKNRELSNNARPILVRTEAYSVGGRSTNGQRGKERAGRRNSKRRSRHKEERSLEVYEMLKSAGHIRLASEGLDSHIPSFFDLYQAKKRSCSLVTFDPKLLKGKADSRRVSRSCAGRIGPEKVSDLSLFDLDLDLGCRVLGSLGVT